MWPSSSSSIVKPLQETCNYTHVGLNYLKLGQPYMSETVSVMYLGEEGQKVIVVRKVQVLRVKLIELCNICLTHLSFFIIHILHICNRNN